MASLSLITAPDPRQQLETLQRELYARNRQLAEAEEALRQEKLKSAALERGVAELRSVLIPLYQGLQHIFGQIEATGVGEQASQSSSSAPKNSAAWEQWKQRLGGATARAIDALMVHGEMNQTQLRIILGCATRTVTNVVTALNQAKLIDKRDGKIRLKEL
jgi:chromosome segregation ATPase